MKFFNYVFAFFMVLIKYSVSNRWGVLWYFQLVFLAIGFGDLVSPKNVPIFNSFLVLWSTGLLILLNAESTHNEDLSSLLRKLSIFGMVKSVEEQSDMNQ